MIYLIPTIVLAAILVYREIQHERQVQSLLDRIQAPTQVIAQRAMPEPTGEPLHIPEDDEAWEKYLEDRDAGKVA